MTLLSRWLLAAATALVFTAAPASAAPVQWPQAHSDLPVDAAIRFGTLPNGMRYAIKRNPTPVGGVSLRFRINAGSLMERDSEQGIAHMLEHMAFRGSQHVADGDMVRTLQGLGLTFGADTNAFTAASQTVYSFDMPKNDAASIDTALTLLREIAGRLNIAKAALDTERNVVLAEARLRDVPAVRAVQSNNAFLYGGRAAAALTPIGLQDIIAHATPELVRGFYEAWYRPERATLIIVGDVDPAAVEAKIKADFADWRAKAPPRKPAVYTPPKQHPAPVKLYTEPGAPPAIAFDWLRPRDYAHDNRANEARDLTRLIALGVLNARLAKLAHGTAPPFIAASAGRDHVETVADAAELNVSYRDGQMLDGLQSAERIWREAVAHGVRQDEIGQVVAQMRIFYQSEAAADGTTPSSQVIEKLLQEVDNDNVMTSPATDLTLFEAVVKDVTVRSTSDALKFVFGGAGPLVFISSPAAPPGGEGAAKAALAQADATPLSSAFAALPPWPYAQFGTPGTVAAKSTVDDLGITYVRFANNVTLTIKPTQLHVGQVLLDVRFGQGRLGLPRDAVTPVWALSGSFIAGGLAHYTFDDLQKLMSGKQWSASIGAGDDMFTLRAETRAADLAAQLQVLTAYVTDPGWQPEALDQMRIASAASYAEAQASPGGVFGRAASGLLHDGDPRWRAPDLAQINAATIDGEKAILSPALAASPLDVTVIGDVTVDQAIAAVAATFGALPPRPQTAPPTQGDEHFPAGNKAPVVLVHHGAANQAIAAIAWPTMGFHRDMKLQRTLRVLAEIFSQRLLDELRTREGITYTPQAGSSSSTTSPDYGYLYALAQIPPDKVANFYAAVAQVAADLTTAKVGDAELDRARGPRIEDIQRQQQANEYWLGLLAGSQRDPRLLDVIRSTISDLKSVTADDVQKAARDWFRDDKAFKFVVVPDAPPPAAAAR